MIKWRRHLDISDVFHSEEIPFAQKLQVIVARLRSLTVEDSLLKGIIDNLAESTDVEEFDVHWDALYDWADQGKRLWIQTRGGSQE